MRRIIYCLTFLIFAAPAMAQTTKLKLINPDGTPAVDAQAIAIMVPFTRVDSNLKELPSLETVMPKGGGTRALENQAGEIIFDSNDLAVIAQNQAGFAFIPLPIKSSSVKLRPWAKLKVDPTAFASQQQVPQRVTVLWENCFAGNPIRPAVTSTQDDPFGSDEPVPKIDWRFDSIVLWSVTLDIKSDQMVNVPPGEVTLMVSPEDVAVADWKGPFANTRFRPVRLASGKQTTLEMPSCGTIRGQLIDADLPSWNDGENVDRFIYATPGGETSMPEEFEKFFTGLDVGPGTILDELAKRYASDAGMRYRFGLLPTAHARVSGDGTFRFVNLPVGKYQLSLFQPNYGGAMPKLKRRGEADDKPLVVELTGNTQHTDIGEVEIANTPLKFYAPKESLPQDDPFGGPITSTNSNDPFGNNAPVLGSSSEPKTSDSLKAAEEKIQYALASRTEPFYFRAVPLSRVIAILQDNHGIPIRLSSLKLQEAGIDLESPVTIELPSLTLQSALRHILSTVSDRLTFTIRDEMLLITIQEDAALDAAVQQPQPAVLANNLKSATPNEFNSGEEFIDRWLKTAKNASDQAALRSALLTHLEKEFDANQKIRRAELNRLQELLQQSKAWLDSRQARRSEIVGKRLSELLDQKDSTSEK